MSDASPPTRERAAYFGKKVRAYLVHVYTASGVVFAFLAATQIASEEPEPMWVFAWLVVAGLVDATDGPLARRWDVKTRAPRIGGRTIDDLLDYLTFAFLPLLLMWRMDWLATPVGLWVVLAMMASLFGFANTAAKQEEEGFFLGFPSYWNIVAYYVGLFATRYGADGVVLSTVLVVVLAALTVVPVRFLYPNRAPKPWRTPVLVGAALWLGLLLVVLPTYPAVPDWAAGWLVPVSLLYPAFYFGLSLFLDVQDRRRLRESPSRMEGRS